MISVIVFDLGNVLIPFDYMPVIHRLNDVETGLGDRFKELAQSYYHYHRQLEKNEIQEDEYVQIILNALDNKIGKEEFLRIYSDIFTINMPTAALLPDLARRYQLYLLSNTNSIHQKYGYGHFEFLKNFHRLFLSHEIGAVKPEEKAYRAVELFSQKPPSEHLFIDDIAEYVDGAKRLGWDGIVFRSHDQLVEDLRMKHIL